MSTKDQAARWVIRMTESPDALSADERAEFDEWISNPLHAQEFHAMNTIAVIAADLPAADRTRLSDWAINQATSDIRSRRQLVRWFAVAASFITLLVLGGILMQNQHWLANSGTYVTRTGETRVVAFPEGSVAYMNTRSEVRWIGSPKDRRVSMSDGEVLYEVVHDPVRPFSIMLDNSEIRVLGTRFNVYRKRDGDTTVTVIEGAVQVRGFGEPGWTRIVHANEQLEYKPIGLVREPHAVEAQKSVEWRTGSFQFNDQSIASVLDELVRYTDERVQIQDASIADQRISGLLPTRDVHNAFKALERLAPIEVKEINGTFTLDYKPGVEHQRKD
jgi:transmembrane sensor